MAELKAPQRPRSAVQTTSRWTGVLAGADHQRRAAVAALERGGEIGEHRLHARGVGPRRLGRRLRAPELRRGHHLHGLGDLLRRLDRGDAVAQLLQRRHGARSREGLGEFVDGGLQLVAGLLGDFLLVADGVENVRRARRAYSASSSSSKRRTSETLIGSR